MKGMRMESLSCIVRYLYTTELELGEENALEVLRVANLFCLPAVEEQCCEKILGPISRGTAVDYALLAEQYGISNLLTNSIKYLVKHYEYFAAEGLYNKLGRLAFQMVIENDDLSVLDESNVFDMVVSWVEHDRESRKSEFKELLEHVRLPLLSPNFLVDVVEKSSYVRTDFSCRDLVDEAKNRHLLPKRSKGYLSERMTPRKSTVGYIFLVGGLTLKEKQLCSVERYDLPLQQSFSMPDMSLARSGLGCAIMNKVLYVVGGTDGIKALKVGESMDFGKGFWHWMPHLKTPRRNLGLCSDDIRLYAVGGQVDSNTTLDSMETCDPREGIWYKFGAGMSKPRKYASVCHLNSSLYVVGGHDGSRYLKCCERFDIRACKWDTVAELPHASGLGANGLTVWNDTLVTVGGFDSRQCLDVSYQYDPAGDTWSGSPGVMGCRRTGLGAVTAGNRLYALGGHSGESYLDSVEVLDGESGTWRDLAPLHCRRGAMGVSVLENCYMTGTELL